MQEELSLEQAAEKLMKNANFRVNKTDVNGFSIKSDESTSPSSEEVKEEDAESSRSQEAEEDNAVNKKEELKEEEDEEEKENHQEALTLPNTIEELSDALGIPKEDLLSLKTSVKIGDEEKKIALEEILKNYHADTEIQSKSKALETERQTLAQEIEKAKTQHTQLTEQVKNISATLGLLESQLIQEYQSLDWNLLRQDDPAEYSARFLEFQARQQQLQQVRNNMNAEINRVQQQQQQEQKVAYDAYAKKEREALFNKMPQWKDQAVFQKDIQSLDSYLRQTGFEEWELSQAIDHRQLLIARKAMLYDQLQQNKPDKKKLNNLPKYIKPGAKQSKNEVNSEYRESLRRRLKKSGDIKDAVELLSLR